MTGLLAPLFVHHLDPRLSRALREVAPGRFRLAEVSGWEHLRSLLGKVGPGGFAVVDPLSEGNGRVWPHLAELVSEAPGAAVLAAVAMPPDTQLLRDLRGTGVAGIILLGHDDTPEGLRQTLRQARGGPFRNVVSSVLPQYVAGRRRRLLLAAAEGLCAGGRSEDFAAVLGISESTLIRHCAVNALPPPRRTMAWMRVLLAARLLDDGRRVQEVSRAAGYASESPLRTALRDLVGEKSSEMRSRGALETAARALLRELLERREAQRESAAARRVMPTGDDDDLPDDVLDDVPQDALDDLMHEVLGDEGEEKG